MYKSFLSCLKKSSHEAVVKFADVQSSERAKIKCFHGLNNCFFLEAKISNSILGEESEKINFLIDTGSSSSVSVTSILAKKYKIDQLPLVKTAQTQIADGQLKKMNIYKITLHIQNLEIETFVSVIDGDVELATIGTAILRLFDFSIINGECSLKFK